MASITEYQTVGSREYQEDRMVVIHGFAKLPHFTLCLVCDGHGGYATSEFLIHEYPAQLTIAFDQYRRCKRDKRVTAKPDEKTKDRVTVTLMGLALERCISMWDQHCFGDIARQFDTPKMRETFANDVKRKAFFEKHCNPKEWEEKGCFAGSTLNCMLIDFKKCRAHILNIGDSRTAWIVGDSDIGQTIDHAVKQKLEKTKGVSCDVLDGRLEGILAMSHAVGDNDEPLLGKVKRDYETRVVDFAGRSFRAVTASDGLFDVRTNHQVLYDTFENADAIAQLALKSIAENEEFKRAEMVDKGLMTIQASQTPYNPEFVDNVSIIYVKVPAHYNYLSSKTKIADEHELSQMIRRMSAPRKTSLKKQSKKKEVIFMQRPTKH